MFHPEIPPHVAEVTRHFPPDLKRSIKAALRTLCRNPHEGVPLVHELQGLWKYRVRRFRIVYAVDQKKQAIQVMAIGHRRDVYDEVTERVRRNKKW
ncbi:MAG: type II toxin-antitoxin system RelE/ParE family toxin [Nitrospira sp.]|nr:type II toxin-antitoxin system RelE/ParE family toxin [Nitrospira sp.]